MTRQPHADVTCPDALATFLVVLRLTGQQSALTTLMAHDPTAHLGITRAPVTGLLDELWAARQYEALPAGDREAVAKGPQERCETRQDQAMAELMALDPVAHADRTDPSSLHSLLPALRGGSMRRSPR
ncbi:hypothetical protein AB0D54_24455 [Streptomyces xanthophaeus]|uniref:hypothetical protein n=1 Tax=Streptomyces xanthophaeus TaxID=67385 RepID=UPI0034188798